MSRVKLIRIGNRYFNVNAKVIAHFEYGEFEINAHFTPFCASLCGFQCAVLASTGEIILDSYVIEKL